ncbi:hypothetical protein XNC1_1042 [Xenorhabdus nematophila ATCC 19061]|uniref:Uncharacterized protein n=1 Tax=Xenorhabdus nematophila (strain ATCC 19061 / DSM 3370 / CCUG 14189 / LMG 1036 / NCIMB 9965 / AN6) TaxID=406817 RepID=D3V8R5_XENNA|nr:hypothetical protein XNC1_1042 [Xenorhabdus nematophila ATCC 19061]
MRYIPVVFQVAALLAALTHPCHIVIYAPGDSFLAVALHLEIQWVYMNRNNSIYTNNLPAKRSVNNDRMRSRENS